ncbi:hypothetical protein TSOC_012738, partial [Tetrabaena socialis]
MFELEQGGGGNGKFSKMLRRRLEGGSGGGIPDLDPSTDDAGSDSDSVGTAFSGRAHRNVPPSLSPEDFPVLTPGAPSMSESPTTPVASLESFLEATKPQPVAYTTLATAEVDADPVQEYDIL